MERKKVNLSLLMLLCLSFPGTMTLSNIRAGVYSRRHARGGLTRGTCYIPTGSEISH